jgi:DNA-directed RNA polymerase subunit RPC12/RpoP
MSEDTLRCPDCGARLKVPDGKSIVRCSKCGEKVRIPDEDELDDGDYEDEEERPRKRRKREPEGDGPWLIAALAAPICFFLIFGGAFLIRGTAGLPAGNDGPRGKLIGLAIGFVVSLVLTVMGTLSVKNRQAYSKWGTEIQGGTAVGLGFVQVVIGGLMGGICLYGLIFTLVNGR